jgi:hypothetical protein
MPAAKKTQYTVTSKVTGWTHERRSARPYTHAVLHRTLPATQAARMEKDIEGCLQEAEAYLAVADAIVAGTLPANAGKRVREMYNQLASTRAWAPHLTTAEKYREYAVDTSAQALQLRKLVNAGFSLKEYASWHHNLALAQKAAAASTYTDEQDIIPIINA